MNQKNEAYIKVERQKLYAQWPMYNNNRSRYMILFFPLLRSRSISSIWVIAWMRTRTKWQSDFVSVRYNNFCDRNIYGFIVEIGCARVICNTGIKRKMYSFPLNWQLCWNDIASRCVFISTLWTHLYCLVLHEREREKKRKLNHWFNRVDKFSIDDSFIVHHCGGYQDSSGHNFDWGQPENVEWCPSTLDPIHPIVVS